ncbi:uncharacterized protein LOC133333076 [Musca vetustissima]|uniref:uncharacterized protein LOC133333076 n=1 Tax=Musca vetustissima TaxID=27455 RepID=UPI002AB686C2|nr:uncharacterized protein LOC133333076 [Musca vetustissima]
MDFIDDFIQEYRNNPCLWKADSVNYKNRSKRQEAYMKLIDVAAKHGEHYNVERTKQKINNLRCAFRHQLKKYNELKSKGEKEEPYCPKRKYFESLMFLKDEETTIDKRTKQDNIGEVTPTIHSSGNNGKNKSTRINVEAESISSVEVADTDKTSTSNSGASASVDVEDPLQVPSNIFSDICKEISKDNNGNDGDEDANIEETAQNISVISDKTDIEEITTITPVRKEQVFVIDTSTVTNATATTTNNTPTTSSPQKQQQQQKDTSKSRKRSSSFSSQHSNETTDTTPIKTAKNDVTFDLENLLSLACKSFQKNSVDHHTSFGEIVAYKLRTMDATQALYAEKIISDILYQGHMKYLSPAAIQRCSNLDRLQTQEHK